MQTNKEEEEENELSSLLVDLDRVDKPICVIEGVGNLGDVLLTGGVAGLCGAVGPVGPGLATSSCAAESGVEILEWESVWWNRE